LLAESEKPGGYAHDSMEIYDYPGDYTEQSEGTTLAKINVEAAQSLDNRRVSMGAAHSLFPGALITLKNCPIEAENQEYLITHCSHSVDSPTYRSGGGISDNPYSGVYETTPSDRQFRAPLVTRRPEVAGFQSALVVGKSGEEIDVDELGRILVQFYWDRKKKQSRRVRVAQFWAGNNRGALFVPRIGDEVLIQYEEGDPDRPIVVGSVYNGTNTVPMKLPDKKTKSGILTQSSKGGNGYHMLLFDDTAGSENVKLRSQKDLLVKALHDETRVIGNDQSETIGGNVTKSVTGDETINIGSQGGNYTLTTSKSVTINGGPICTIVMDATGITLSATPMSSITIQPSGITLNSPMITLQAEAAVTVMAATMSVLAVTDITSLSCGTLSSAAPPLP